MEKLLSFFFFFYKWIVAHNNLKSSPILQLLNNKVVSTPDFILLHLILEDYLIQALKMKNKCNTGRKVEDVTYVMLVEILQQVTLVKFAGCSFNRLHNAGTCQMVEKGYFLFGFSK